jgi:gluconokinase
VTKIASAGRAYVVALDVGTSSVRAILYDRRARPVPGAEVHLRHQPRIASDGTSEVDPARLAGLVDRSLVRLLGLVGPRRASAIAGVGVSTFWHSLVAVDDRARALTPVYLWSDTRSRNAIRHLQDRIDLEAVRQRTGCPIHPTYWPAKLAWLRSERADLWKREVRWLSFGDLLLWRMFGKLGTSLSMASGTGLMRLAGSDWDTELLSELGVLPENLPPIARFEQGLAPAYRRLLPRLADVPWMHALGDGALANFGSGCLTPAKRALTVGTSGALRAMHSSPPAHLPPGLWCYRLDENRVVTGGALSNGGNLRAWLLKNLRLKDAKLEARLGRMAPGDHGLTVLPHLAGERSLEYSPHAFGAIAGITSATTAEQMARAGLEAVAIEFARVDRRLDEVVPGAKTLVASGTALLSSPAWMQMMADAIGRPVAASKAKEASSRGAALYALEYLGLAEPAELDPGVGRIFKPIAASTTAYRRVEGRQEILYRALIRDRILGDAHEAS